MSTKNLTFDIIVIGGGAAGLMAAATAANAGKQVLLLDKNERLGRKLLITGKGRCNITNDCDAGTFMENIPTNPKFLYGAIHAFSTADVKSYFESHGVPLKTERGQRVFPVSDKAADVCNALIEDCRHNGVKVIAAKVAAILQADGAVTGVKIEDGSTFNAISVILATGGKSYPLTGSNGDGYALASALGHTIVEAKPSLVPIVSKDEYCVDMQGLSLKNVVVTLQDNQTGKAIYKELGEMIFTHFGVSGPLILSASAHIKKMEKDRYSLKIDLKPGLTVEQLDTRLLRDFAKFANKDFGNSLEDLLPKKMIPIIVMLSGISPFIKVNQITKEMRQTLIGLLKGLSISVDGFRPIDEAIITSGGIKTTEINPKTMESKLVRSLYFAGEVIDVDGYTGGFNLQLAFSTAYLAAMNA